MAMNNPLAGELEELYAISRLFEFYSLLGNTPVNVPFYGDDVVEQPMLALTGASCPTPADCKISGGVFIGDLETTAQCKVQGQGEVLVLGCDPDAITRLVLYIPFGFFHAYQDAWNVIYAALLQRTGLMFASPFENNLFAGKAVDRLRAAFDALNVKPPPIPGRFPWLWAVVGVVAAGGIYLAVRHARKTPDVAIARRKPRPQDEEDRFRGKTFTEYQAG
jgi:hypothetical protein